MAEAKPKRPSRAAAKSTGATAVEEPKAGVQQAGAGSVAAAAIADAVEGAAATGGIAAAEPTKADLAKAKAEAKAAEEEAAQDMDGTELIDDPVRMYLREIGRVTLLTAARPI